MQSNYFSGLPATGAQGPLTTLPPDTVMGEKYQIVGEPYIGKHKAIYRCRTTRGFARESMLAQPLYDAAEVLEPFENEQRVLARLSHPGIIKIEEQGEDKKHGVFTVYEFLEGTTLAIALRQERRMEVERATELFVQLCNTLSHLHKNKDLHGSLKANHIFLQTQLAHQAESVKLIDFSQSQKEGERRKLNDPQWVEVFQTVGHPSPEALSGEPIDHRSEIYSLGCLLYKALTGKAPFNGTSADEIRKKHMENAVPPLRAAYPQAPFSAAMEACLQKMLAKNPDDRFQNTDDLALDLRYAGRRSRA
ncbi:MAG: serine/threonine protein kinase [Terriglobales bacterium]